MRERLLTRYLLLLGAVAFLFCSRMMLPKTVQLRDQYQLVSRSAKQGVPPEYILTSSLLGGFRGIFITALWIRAQEMKNDGKFYEMVDIYNIITKLQPNAHMAWAFQAWDLTYNVSVEFDEVQDRTFWIFAGVDLLRKQGIPRNPNIPGLYRELAWFFHHKIGADLDYGHPEYRRALALQMDRILRGIPPEEYQVLGEIASLRRSYNTRDALRQAEEYTVGMERLTESNLDPFESQNAIYAPNATDHQNLREDPEVAKVVRAALLWTIGDDLQTQVGLDPQLMYRYSVRYGPIDWRTPYAHALYWADQGYEAWKKRRPDELTLKHERLVYFSLISLVKRGRVVYGDGGYVHYLPNYDMIDGVIRHMDDMMEYFTTHTKPDGTTINLTGAKSGYHNFLRDTIFLSYFGNDITRAASLLAKLAEVSGEDKYKVSLREFVIREFAEWIDSPDIKRTHALIAQWLTTAYQSLAMGDVEGYERSKALVEHLYNGYGLKRWNPDERQRANDPDYRNHLAPLSLLRFRTAMQFFTASGIPLSDWMRANLYVGLRQYEPDVWNRLEAERKRSEAQLRQQQPGQDAISPTR